MDHAHDLAEWTGDRLVNRTDAYGIYAGGGGVTRKSRLTHGIIQAHYEGKHTLGLHTTSTANTCKWLALDFDCHDDDEAVAMANEHTVKRLHSHLHDEFDLSPVVMQSNGAGGFHVLVVFESPLPTKSVCRFGKYLRTSLELNCEVFPKQEQLPEGGYGNWLRLPGKHHTREHWTRIWTGAGWVEGDKACQLLLAVEGDTGAAVLDEKNHYGNATPSAPQSTSLSGFTMKYRNAGAKEGVRNQTLFEAACDYNGCGYDFDTCVEELAPVAERTGLSDREARETINSAYAQCRQPRERTGTQAISMGNGSRLEIAHTPAGRRTCTAMATYDGRVLHADTADFTKNTARSRFVEKLCIVCPPIDETSRSNVEQRMLEIAADESERRARPAPSTETAEADEGAPEVSPEDRRDALEMLNDPDLIRVIVDDVTRLGVAGEKTLAATAFIVGTSRLLPKPVSAIVQGLTSSGKSFVADAVSKLFPAETVLHAHSMTPQALVHMKPGALEHRFVVAGERSRKVDDDAAEATRALREMLSDGKLTKLMPTKRDGVIETVLVEQTGPIAYVESTTLQKIPDEDRNRCLILSTDESPQQTRRILDSLARRKSADDEGDDDDILRRHHAAQRLLRKCRVRIPFAERLAATFPHERTDARRTFGQLLSMIEAVTLLHQYQRCDEPADGMTIAATADDYALARRLLGPSLAQSMGDGVSVAARNFGDRLRARFDGLEFDATEAAADEGVIGDRQTIRAYLRALAFAGAIEQTEEPKGRRPARYRMLPERDAGAVVGLPDAHELFSEDSHARLRGKA